MSLSPLTLAPANTDDVVDVEIATYLNPAKPQSFFLYAGAGSGKTRSLKNALFEIRDKHGEFLRRTSKKVAVITYTKAARNEIFSRVEENALFHISTIHSFCWSQICTFHSDIQKYLIDTIPSKIAELQEKQEKGRAGTKAAFDREKSIANSYKKLEWLKLPREFTYNPNGDNFGQASLSHSEVIEITAHFISTKPSMQVLIVNRFPFLLIDESQDTNKHLIDAFFQLEAANAGHFSLGLVGDTMQRIYLDGKIKLGRDIPDHWKKPKKHMNHRCPHRVIQLGNALRLDKEEQMGRDDGEEGFIRLFILPSDTSNKQQKEFEAATKMAEITSDNKWLSPKEFVKSLTLEHHMAALRMGFLELFTSLDKAASLSTGLRSGELSGLRLFSERVMPLFEAAKSNDDIAIMAILRTHSPLVNKYNLREVDPLVNPLDNVRVAIKEILALEGKEGLTFLEILQCVAKHNLFDIPNSLQSFVDDSKTPRPITFVAEENDEDDDDERKSSSLEAWGNFLQVPYNQIEPYSKYVTSVGAFDTHQGVKGLEFDRVMVVIDDAEARGFTFSYEKLLGVKDLTTNDVEKMDNEESSVDHTRRLLYVTCTRAEKSLALVAYTTDPDKLAASVVNKGWFLNEEIIRF